MTINNIPSPCFGLKGKGILV